MELIAKLVSEAIRGGYKAVDLWQTTLGLYVVVVEEAERPVVVQAEAIAPEDWADQPIDDNGDCLMTVLEPVETRRSVMFKSAKPLPQDKAEFKKLTQSMYDVGWTLTRKGSGYRLAPHSDVGGRADIGKRFAYLIEPLQREIAETNASLAAG